MTASPIAAHALPAVGIVLLGLASGYLSGSGARDPWFATLDKPWFMPPGWLFPIAWTTLYLLMGFAIGDVLVAPAGPARSLAIALFSVQLALNLVWSPIFFGAHRTSLALATIIALDLLVLATGWAFAAIALRPMLLLLPYGVWLALATALNAEIVRLNR